MKKHLFCLLALLGLWSTSGMSQNLSPAPPTSELGNPLLEQQEAVSSLDANRIPTKVLFDRTVYLTDPHRFSGGGNATTDYSGFTQQYGEFYHASLSNESLLPLEALRGRVTTYVRQGTIPLLMLRYDYNEISATAFRDNLLTIDSVNERLLDGPNFSRSPYETRQFFSVVVPLPIAGGTAAIYVGPEFWLGNIPAPATLSIDFGDGLGYRNVAMGSTVAIAAAPQSSTVRVQIPPQFGVITGNPDEERTTKNTTGYVPIRPALQATATTNKALASAASIPPDQALGLVASRLWPNFSPSKGKVRGPNGHASAIAWIKYAEGNTSSPRRLRHPLVFVEGIDFPANRNKYPILNYAVQRTGFVALSEFDGPGISAGGYRNGNAGWNEVVDYNEEYPTLEKFPELRAQLQASSTTTLPDGSQGSDYDIIYLDFSDGASLIQDNAMVLVELLEWINKSENRTPTPRKRW